MLWQVHLINRNKTQLTKISSTTIMSGCISSTRTKPKREIRVSPSCPRMAWGRRDPRTHNPPQTDQQSSHTPVGWQHRKMLAQAPQLASVAHSLVAPATGPKELPHPQRYFHSACVSSAAIAHGFLNSRVWTLTSKKLNCAIRWASEKVNCVRCAMWEWHGSSRMGAAVRQPYSRLWQKEGRLQTPRTERSYNEIKWMGDFTYDALSS